MNLDKLKSDLDEFVRSKGMKLYDVSYHKSDSTLEVLLDEKLDMDQIEKISAEISQHLDQFENEFEDNYFLDVSTAGLERAIRNEDELKDAVGSYIYVKTKENEYYGTLLSYTDGIMNLEVRDKTRTKKIDVDYTKAKKVRYAVKF